jgi:hypothetical protein
MIQTMKGRYKRSDMRMMANESVAERFGKHMEVLIRNKIRRSGIAIEECLPSTDPRHPILEDNADGIIGNFFAYPIPIEIKSRIDKGPLGPDNVNREDIFQCAVHCLAFGTPFCALYEWNMKGDEHYMALVHTPDASVVQRIVDMATLMVSESGIERELWEGLLDDVSGTHISTVFLARRTSIAPLHYDVKISKDSHFISLDPIQFRHFINYMVM